MNKMPKLLSQIIYGLLGFIFTAAGFSALIKPDIIMKASEDAVIPGSYISILQEGFMHITQELGTTLIGLGAVLIWAIFNTDKMTTLNYVLLLFFALFAGIHWMEFFEDNRSIMSPLINSIPAVLVLVAILLQRQKE